MDAMIWVFRLIAVLAALVVASLLATPHGRLPLVVRGMVRMMRHDRGENVAGGSECGERVSGRRKFFAFSLLLIAIILAVL